MKKILITLLLIISTFSVSAEIPGDLMLKDNGSFTGKRNHLTTYDLFIYFTGFDRYNTFKEHRISLEKLKKAYPGFIKKIKPNAIVWTDGSELPFDDGIKNKNFDRLLNEPDMEDMFRFKYSQDADYPIPPEKNYDPGRIRYEPFFIKMYGKTKEEVLKNLVEITWLPETLGLKLKVTRVNGVNRKLRAVSEELDRLPDRFKKYLENPGGTFAYRFIAGTQRLSVHSFGIAVDINVKHSHYWLWHMDEEDEPVYKNLIPIEIVEIFEKYGFIWGGKWYHYDTMHFEYRPELLVNE